MLSDKLVMMKAFALCPSDKSHPEKMEWIAAYFRTQAIEQAVIAEQAAPAGDVVGFEQWLRTVCFQTPTPEAYELAKCAWSQPFKQGGTSDGWFNYDCHCGWQQVSKEFEGGEGQTQLFTTQQPAECKRCAELESDLKDWRSTNKIDELYRELGREKAKVAELTADRDSADAFSKKLADVCEKAEAQVIALMAERDSLKNTASGLSDLVLQKTADKARAEAVIEIARDTIDWVFVDEPHQHREKKLLAAIADYQAGVKS